MQKIGFTLSVINYCGTCFIPSSNKVLIFITETMQEQSNNPKNEMWNLSIRDIFFKYIRFLPWIVISVSISLLGAYLYLRYSTPIYNVGGTLLIKSETRVPAMTNLMTYFPVHEYRIFKARLKY
jgi:hypothetical protein